MIDHLAIPWGWLSIATLAAIYVLLALFRAAHLDLPRVKLGTVLRAAVRTGGVLERWVSKEDRGLLLLASQICFQSIPILIALLLFVELDRLAPEWAMPVHLALAFALTVGVLAVGVRLLLVRVLVALFPGAAVRISAPVAATTALLLLPILMPMDRLTRFLAARFGRRDEARGRESEAENVRAFVALGEEEGILEKDEIAMVRNVVDFGDTIVREIMTPRTGMVVLDHHDTLGNARERFLATKHARMPVQLESPDHIEGVLALKDLLPAWGDPSDTPIAAWVRPAYFVPETKRVLDLLREMQRKKAAMALVVDEYGGTAGLVTVEDLVEEIVGEIHEEHETREPVMVVESPGIYLVSGFADLSEVAEKLDMDVRSVDVDTVGGLVTSLLGRVPQAGECLEHAGVRMEVVAADRRKVHKIRMERATSAVLAKERE